jgi:ribosome biogenesis protein MAK21
MSQPVTSNPDLTQNTLSHFLDRFVYKNPKKAKAGEGGAKTKGASAMQPAASGLDGQGVKIMKADADGASMRINEAAFLRRKESDVPVDQVSRVE